MIYRLSRSDMQLRLCNRSQYPTRVRLLSVDQFMQLVRSTNRNSDTGDQDPNTCADLSGGVAAGDGQLRSVVNYAIRQKVTAEFELPSETILLPARDDLAEYELSAPQNLSDDPK